MICPKCQNIMQTVDRGGIHIEQCQGCRGIFLDRGELEQIAGAEQRYHQAAPPMAPPGMYRGDSAPPYRGGGHGDSAPPYRGGGHGGYKDSAPPYGGGYGRGHGDSPPPYGHGGQHGHRRKRKSFLEELFD
ncbi:MAG: zf-TFIIB domain-containing protein [Kibdelosporangium sp.]